MSVDLISNGQGSGTVASRLLANNMNPAILRPYINNVGQAVIAEHNPITNKWEEKPVFNADATLRKDDWIKLDQSIIKVAKPRLQAVADLRGAGLEYSMPNGMAHTVLQHEVQSDITPATVSMDGIREADRDRPVFDLRSLPLPIIHKDFSYSARQIAASRNGMSPLDTTTAELAARQVAEEAENMVVGNSTAFSFADGTIYGYTDFPQRLTKSMTAPTGSNHDVILQEVLQMKTQSQDANYYGPWFCYCSTSWDEFMDDDYSQAKGDNTLRDRIGKIEGIDRPKTLDYLPANTLLLVQKTSDVARVVVGMDITTVQWESKGGMEFNFKVMAIIVPQLRSDYNGNTGIVHGTHA